MLSIIIITLNEEKYLSILLESIKNQDFKDYEVIVSDAGSKDKTVEIAKKFGCKIVKGGLPAVGRNNGAKVAKGNLLLFLDADTLMPDRCFLSRFLEEFSKRKLDITTCKLRPDSGSWSDKFVMGSINTLTLLVKNFWPHVHGGCTLCKKGVHEKINGFNDGMMPCEDTDYAIRATKFFRFGIINNVGIIYSTRRFRKSGFINMILKYTFIHATRLFLGKIEGNKFNYFLKSK